MSELKVETIKPAFGNKVTVSPGFLVTDSLEVSKFEITTQGTVAIMGPLYVGTSFSKSAGTAGQVLHSQGAGSPPVWTSLPTPIPELPTGGTVGQVLTNQTPNSPTWTTLPTLPAVDLSNIVFTQTTVGNASLTLPAGTWVCECYGDVFQCDFAPYSIQIGGVTVMTTTNNGDQQGCAYSPIAGIRKITLTTTTAVVFEVTPQDGWMQNRAIMVCKATKVVA